MTKKTKTTAKCTTKGCKGKWKGAYFENKKYCLRCYKGKVWIRKHSTSILYNIRNSSFKPSNFNEKDKTISHSQKARSKQLLT